jgi:hypothetical protein
MRRTPTYMPGTDVIDITAPGGIDALIAFHYATFGDARMEATGDTGGDGDTGGGTGGAPQVNEHGFPDRTPVADMAPEQQAAYWKHQARKHEDRVRALGDYEQIKTERDRLKAEHQTADEKALEDAQKAAADAARADERGKYAPRLFAAEFRAAAAGRIPAEKLAAIIEPLDTTKFLTPDGEVDADKVKQFVDGIAPDGKKWPDMGQGHHETTVTTGVGAGRSLYEERHAKKK